ncbi:MAG TPA: hypothetical protein VJ770_26300, partial [Stellaceae bacterium]|nr:hypothetical protein [Stellaceae bacterium]
MNLGAAERLASANDPKSVAALEAQSADPAVRKAVAEQFGRLLMQRILQNGDGEAIAMTGGAGGNIVNALFADTITKAAMSGDRLGLADLLFRSLAAAPTAAAPAATVAAAASGFPLAPYWQGGGLRPLSSGG